jgi:hypothetical protein
MERYEPIFADSADLIFAHMSSLAAELERSISARGSPLSAAGRCRRPRCGRVRTGSNHNAGR